MQHPNRRRRQPARVLPFQRSLLSARRQTLKETLSPVRRETDGPMLDDDGLPEPFYWLRPTFSDREHQQLVQMARDLHGGTLPPEMYGRAYATRAAEVIRRRTARSEKPARTPAESPGLRDIVRSIQRPASRRGAGIADADLQRVLELLGEGA